jgi:signal peptidase II
LNQIFKIQVSSVPVKLCLAVSSIVLILDQITKVLTERFITSPIQVIPNLFSLVYVKNPGAAWGILAGKGSLLLIISIVVLILMTIYMRKLTEGWIERYFSISLIFGGIFGNSLDRIFRGSVVDFLDFYVGTHHWPAFNVADSAICVGVFIFIISSWIRPEAPAKQ